MLNVYGQLNIEFKISYSSGTASEKDGQGALARIATGAVDGAINSFIFKDTSHHKDLSWYNPSSQQIFVRQGGYTKSPGYGLGSDALAHEVGHLLRRDKLSGATLFGYNSSNLYADLDINAANSQLRKGNVRYERDWVDDYRGIKEVYYTSQLAKLGPEATRRVRDRVPNTYDLYRLGARLIGGHTR